jgi:polyprenyl P-hydroxybenzoate/phenylacrylic acid decarboxylase-like protein
VLRRVLIQFVSAFRVTTRPVLVVGLSGSSGAQYGIRLLRILHQLDSREIHLVISRGAEKTLRLEVGIEPSELYPLADHVHEPDEMAASISSGSFLTDGMVICPCSMRSLAAVATGNADSLLIRAADVCLKERRRLVLVTRETPLNLIHLRNMVTVTEAGATVLPPVTAFYHQPKTIEDLIDQTVGKVLDQFGIEHQTFRRWDGSSTRPVSAHPNGDRSI